MGNIDTFYTVFTIVCGSDNAYNHRFAPTGSNGNHPSPTFLRMPHEEVFPSGIETQSSKIGQGQSSHSGRPSRILEIASPHLKLTQVILNDATDRSDELVQERVWLLHPNEDDLALDGNLFQIEDTIHQAGYIFIKRAPLPSARKVPANSDFRVTFHREAGVSVRLYENESEGTWTVLQYEGGELGRTQALQNWQREQRPDNEIQRLPRFLSNTWGDRSQDSRMREEFILAEIDAAPQIGVEVIQLDDGWQQGTSANSTNAQDIGGVWENFWQTNPEFWEVNPDRFPNGLHPILAHAKNKAIEIGLWYAPDSWNSLENWKKDAEKVLELHRTYGIRFFKVDSLNVNTDEGRKNLRAFFNRVLTESRGEVLFDLDITAGKRPGYLGEISVGPLFVENRYSDWRSYWPHHTLRNLWQLSRWIDSKRLRMEFLNKERNTAKYSQDPLAPAHYKSDTLFATVMFANPLGWFECSNLPNDYQKDLAPLVQKWKDHRQELFSGTILPIGKEPDGIAYTGFMSIAVKKDRGFILIFRERNPSNHARIELPSGLELEKVDWEILSPNGAVESESDFLRIQIPESLDYVFARFIARA